MSQQTATQMTVPTTTAPTTPSVATADTSAPNTLTPEMQAQLEQLKDIQVPEPISWFPLAMGWWLLIIFIVIALVCAYWWFMRRQNPVKAIEKSALAELTALSQAQEKAEIDTVQFISELSALLRRVAIYSHSGQQERNLSERNVQEHNIQNLSGQVWAEFLSGKQDTSSDNSQDIPQDIPQGIPQELAELIAHVPYNNKLADNIANPQLTALKQASETWIITALKGRTK